MRGVSYRQAAKDDLSEIWEYTSNNWSVDQADKYHLSLTSLCSKLARSPELGKSYPSISSDIFGYRKGKHIIFYSVSESDIEIVRILHTSMDIGSHFGE